MQYHLKFFINPTQLNSFVLTDALVSGLSLPNSHKVKLICEYHKGRFLV